MCAKSRTTLQAKITAKYTNNNNKLIRGLDANEIATDQNDITIPATAADDEITFIVKDTDGARQSTDSSFLYDNSTKLMKVGGIRTSKDIIWNPDITGLTGGGSTNLDGIVTDGVSPSLVGAIIGFYYDSKIQFYQLQAYTGAESSPAIIRPDDWSGTNKVAWFRIVEHSATDHQELKLTTNNTGSELYLSAGTVYYNKILKQINAATLDVSLEADGDYILFINSAGAVNYSAFSGFPFTDTADGKYYIAIFTMSSALVISIVDVRNINVFAHAQGHDVLSSSDHLACAAGDKGKFIRFNASTGAIEAVALSSMNYGDFSSFTKVTINYGDLNVAATTKQIEVIAAMPAKGLIIEGFQHLRNNFTGGAISALTMAQQNGSNTFASALSVFSGAGDQKVQRFSFATNNYQSDMVNTWAYNILFSSTGANLNALTSGAIDIYYKISYLP